MHSDGELVDAVVLATPAAFPDALLLRVYSGATLSVRYAGSFDEPSSAGIVVSVMRALKNSRWLTATNF